MPKTKKTTKSNKKSPIKKDSKILDVAEKYPDAAAVMFEYGMHCIGCIAAQFETIEQGAAVHGIKGKKLEEMVKKMNKKIK